jgi:hypothetical protein
MMEELLTDGAFIILPTMVAMKVFSAKRCCGFSN